MAADLHSLAIVTLLVSRVNQVDVRIASLKLLPV